MLRQAMQTCRFFQVLILLSPLFYAPVLSAQAYAPDRYSESLALYEARDYRSALTMLDSVAKVDERRQTVDSLTGLALHRAAVAADIIRLYDTASCRTPLAAQCVSRTIGLYQRAVAVRDRVFPEPHNDRAKSRSNLGNLYLELNRLDSGAYWLYSAHELYAATAKPDYRGWARTLSFLLTLARERNDSQLGYSIAPQLEAALARGRAAFRPQQLSRAYYTAAQDLNYLDAYKAANRLAHQSVSINRDSEASDRLAKDYNLLYSIAIREGRDTDGAAYLDSMLYYMADDPSNEAVRFATINLADLAIRRGDAAGARNQLELAEARRDTAAVYQTFLALVWSRYYEESGDAEQALRYANRAVGALTACPKAQEVCTAVATETLAAERLDLLATVLSQRAAVLAKLSRYPAALRHYHTLILARERERRELLTAGSRNRLSATLRPQLNEAIAAAYDAHRAGGADSLIRQALQFAENARAYGLLRARRQAGPRPGRQFARRTEAARLERAAQSGDAPARRALAELRMELDRERAASQPDYAPLPSLDLSAARRQIGGEVELRVYHIGERGFLFRLPAGR